MESMLHCVHKQVHITTIGSIIVSETTTAMHKTIGIIGGGIMGITLAYRLSQQGFAVSVYERGKTPGGLASFMTFEGLRIDRFYHTILSSDMSMHTLIEASGVADARHFTETKQAFYDAGQLYPFNTFTDLLTFPPLSLPQRIRLGLQIVYAQLNSDWRTMDKIPVERWLMQVSGRQVYEKVWKPLLRAKFDTTYEDVPATYIWSRLKRMLGTRQGVTSKEMMCYLENGYFTLIEGLLKKCEAQGVQLHLESAVKEISITDGRATGIQFEDGTHVTHDIIVSTLPSSVLAPLLPAAPQDFQQKLASQQYLGVLCPLLILKKRLTPYYVINITDDRIPFTAVVETTNLIDPAHVGGRHLVYLPRYLAPDNEMYTWDDEQVKTAWLDYLHRMFPDFDDTSIEAFIVQRARYVEPIRPMNTLEQIPTIKTPVAALYMGNTAMFYPDLGNGEAVTRFTTDITTRILEDYR